MNLSIAHDYLPFVLPLIILQISLIVIALLKLKKMTRTTYLNKAAWVLIILLVNIVGPIAFITIEGKKQ
ncbi:PLDc N-terminal domain-containing protein [Streptococcus catagoni]|uniref:PLDc N-terminal domain-containing protein n=1 Tax=Streptococcus catagoni TaxID=2654874 RepID=UPI00140E04B7|nr:PLDc N-terminal domain-containing protein [Streptococcus catagoni]